MREDEIKSMRRRSGHIDINSCLVSFLYELMRDHITPGQIEEVLQNSINDPDVQYTNGWLAKYAEDIANRLIK